MQTHSFDPVPGMEVTCLVFWGQHKIRIDLCYHPDICRGTQNQKLTPVPQHVLIYSFSDLYSS